MNLYEAKKILEKNGCRLLKEYSAFDDTFSHDSEGWSDTEKRFQKGLDIIKSKINSFGIDIETERVSEPTPMSDTWRYKVEGTTAGGKLEISFNFEETWPENRKDEKNELYPYMSTLHIRGDNGINFYTETEREYDPVKAANMALDELSKIKTIDLDINKPIMDAVKSAIEPLRTKGFETVANWDPDFTFSIIDAVISKDGKTCLSLHIKFNRDFTGKMSWKIYNFKGGWSYELLSSDNGNLKDFAQTIRKIIGDFYTGKLQQLKQERESNKKNVAYREANKREKMLKDRRVARVKKLFAEDMINNFDLCREIDENTLDKLIMDHVANKITEYVYDNYSDEDGEVMWWDDDDAWDYFDWGFCEFLDKEWNGDFKKFCEENDIVDYDTLSEFLDEWDWELPSEPRD